MASSRKHDIAVLVQSIRDRREVLEVQQVFRLLAHLDAQYTDELVSCKADELVDKRSKVQTVRQILSMLRDERPTIEPARSE